MKTPKRELGEFSDFRNGVNFVAEDQGVVAKVVGVGDFQGRTEISTYESLSEIQLRSTLSPDDELMDGDLLFVRSNGNKNLVGRCMVIRKPPAGVTFSGFTIRARLDRSVALPDYVSLVFQGGALKRQMALASGGNGNISNLNQGLLSSMPIGLPSLGVQESIVTAGFVWNAAIEKTEQLIAAKRRRNQALSNQLLFGHVRFRQGNTKTTRLLHWFSAPSDWQVVEIGKVAREVSTLNENDDELPILSCTKHDGLVESLKYFDKKVFNHDTSKSKIVLRGQFAYATNHIEEGSIGYQDLVSAGVVSPIYTVFQTNVKKINDGYLYKLLKTEKLRQIFAANTNASVDRRGSLRWKEFSRIHIPLPPLDEQREINAVLDDAKREVALLQAEVEALKKQKRGLMQKLLTGQWRVPMPSKEAIA